MSFDLFIICPRFDRAVAERFNEFECPGFPPGLSIDLEQCASDSTFWTINQDDEEWVELHIDRNASNDYAHKPANIDGWIEIHVPSHGHPDVLHAVAALAELSAGWVFDPQGTAKDVSLQGSPDQVRNVESGFYTAAITRTLANELAMKYRWD